MDRASVNGFNGRYKPRDSSEASGEDRDSSVIEESDSDSDQYGELDLEKGISILDLTLNPEDLKKHLKRGSKSEKDEFVEYFLWAMEEIRAGGAELEERLKALKGKFEDGYKEWQERSLQFRTMRWSDKRSTKIREGISMLRRDCTGLGEGGDPPEKKKDLITTRSQARAYPLWMGFQDVRVVLTALLTVGQVLGVYPVRAGVAGTVNVTEINDTSLNFTGGNSTTPDGLYDPETYRILAALQITFTVLTLIPYLFLHAPPQFRSFLRGTVEQNKARKTALNGFAGAVRYMTSEAPTAMDANVYTMAMPKWRAHQSKAARLDVLRMKFSTLREGIFFPVNMSLALLNSINLATGQSIPGLGLPLVAGSIQLVGGLAGVGQGIVDGLQALSEYFSAALKFEKNKGCTEKIRRIPVNSSERQIEEAVEDALYACIANSTALDYQKRQGKLQSREKIWAWIRGLKGVAGVCTSFLSAWFGGNQLATREKAGIPAVLTSNVATGLSGQYYISSYLKMHGRDVEEHVAKKFHENAQFIRLNFDDLEIKKYMLSRQRTDYVDYKHLFQDGKLGAPVTRDAPFEKNEYLLLELMTVYLMGKLNNTGAYRREFGRDVDVVQKIMQLPLITWLVGTWGTSSCEIEALLRACCDKAVAYQISTCREMLARSMEIPLPNGRDDKEKRVKPSMLILAKIRHFEVNLDDDGGKTFERVKKDYKSSAARNWRDPDFHENLMRGTGREEFIAAAMHIDKRSKMPDRLLPEHIQFAKLMAVAEYAQRERMTGLNTVAAADFDEWDFPPGLKRKIDTADFALFQELVETYAGIAISNRGEQMKALKKLSQNDTMQEFNKLFEDQEGNRKWLKRLKKNRKLFTGIILLVDRVDKNQPLPFEPPSSPRDPAPANVTIARGWRRAVQDADDSSSEERCVTDSDGSYTSSSSDADEVVDGVPEPDAGASDDANRSTGKRRLRVDDSAAMRVSDQQPADARLKRENYNDDDNDVDNRSAPSPFRGAGRSTASSPGATSINLSSSRSKYVEMLRETRSGDSLGYRPGPDAGTRHPPTEKLSPAKMHAVSKSSAQVTTLEAAMTSSDADSSGSKTDSRISRLGSSSSDAESGSESS